MKHNKNQTESRLIPEGLTAPTPSFTMISHQNAVAMLLFSTPPCKRGEKPFSTIKMSRKPYMSCTLSLAVPAWHMTLYHIVTHTLISP
jgi:hypothetical protein